MKNKLYIKRIQILCLLLFLLISIILSSYFIFNKEIDKKPILKKKIETRDIEYLYDFYINPNPNIQEKVYLGFDDAPIKIIAYLDINSDASRYFLAKIYPELYSSYIQTGKIKFYPKIHISIEDVNNKNDKFIYATTLQCIRQLKNEKYFDIYFKLYNTSPENILQLITKYNISSESYTQCKENLDNEDFIEEVSEIENLGLQGISQRFYIGINNDLTILDGVPSINKFKQTIKQYQIMIGD